MAGNLKPCDTGTMVEMQIAAEFTAAGARVCLPWGHAQGYDMVTDMDGVLKRVQCRSSAYRDDRDRYDADLRKPRPFAGDRLACQSDFDVLAVMAGGHCYIIPAALVAGRSGLVLRPPGCRQQSGGPVTQFDPEDYRQAWSVLKEG